MRKQELIHVHGLLVEVRRYLREHDDVPAGAFAGYEAYGVGPTAIHRHKDAHKEAIGQLLDGIGMTLTVESATSEAVATQSS